MSQESSGKHLFSLFITRIWPLVKFQPKKKKSKLLTGHVQPQQVEPLPIIICKLSSAKKKDFKISVIANQKSLGHASKNTTVHEQ